MERLRRESLQDAASLTQVDHMPRLSDAWAFPPEPALRFESGWRTALDQPYCGFHDHLFFEVVYHPAGSGTTTVHDGTVIRFSPGSVVLYPPHERHDQMTALPATDVTLLFTSRLPIPEPLKSWRHIPNVRDSFIVSELTSLARPLPSLTRGERALYDHRITTLILHLLELPATSPSLNEPATASSYAEQAWRYIREHYQEIDRLETVAEALGISHDHLRHEFKRRYSISPKQALLGMRLEQAKELLKRSVLPLKAIAELTGFDNERYFCTCFRKREGMTPGMYRRQS